MEFNNIEKRLRDELLNRETFVDTDEVWANIEGKLEEKKKRRFLIWWFLGLGILLGVASYLLPKNQQKAEPILSKTANLQSIKTVSAEKEYCPEYNEEPRTEFDSRALSPSQNPARESRKKNKNQKRQETAWLDKLMNPDAVRNAPKENASNTTKPDAVTPTQIEEVIEDKTQVTKEPLGEERTAPKEPRDTIRPQIQKKPNKRKKRKRRTWHHAIGLYGEAALPLRQFSTWDGSPTHDIIDIRENHETTQESMGFGFEYLLRHKEGFFLTTGVQYRQITEKMNFSYTDTEWVQANVVVSYTVLNDRDSIANYGVQQVEQTTERTKISYNRYKLLNIPVGIGMRFGGQKTRMEISGGMDYNLYYRPSGSYVFGQTTRLLEPVTNRPSVGFGLWAGAALEHQVAKGLSIFANPFVKRQLGSLTPDTYSIRHRYTLFGMRLGLRVAW